MGRRFEDLTGKQFGRLTVIKRNGSNKHKQALWLCKCECGNEISVPTASLNSGNTKSCGCYNKDVIKERSQSEEFKQRSSNMMKELNKKQWQNEEFKQMHIKMQEERWKDEEFKQKHSDMMKKLNEENWNNEEYRAKMSGINAPNYNPELTDEDRENRRIKQEYKQWSKEVKEQADYTCDCCGKRGYELHSHHLNSWNAYKEQRYDLANGVCLCESCHKEFHKLYGKGDNTKEQYIEFKENKLTKQEQ